MAGYIIFTFVALLIYSLFYRLIPRGNSYDFILIHGAGLIGGSQVSPLLAGRLDKGIEVFHRYHGVPEVIVSGGQGSDESVSEADAMADYLLQKGIPEDKIIREDRSTTTQENVSYAKQLMDERKSDYRVLFVTNDYHVFRTGLYTKKAGLKADGVGSKTAFYYWPTAFIREYIAIMLSYKYVPVILFVIWLILTIISISPFGINVPQWFFMRVAEKAEKFDIMVQYLRS